MEHHSWSPPSSSAYLLLFLELSVQEIKLMLLCAQSSVAFLDLILYGLQPLVKSEQVVVGLTLVTDRVDLNALIALSALLLTSDENGFPESKAPLSRSGQRS